MHSQPLENIEGILWFQQSFKIIKRTPRMVEKGQNWREKQ